MPRRLDGSFAFFVVCVAGALALPACAESDDVGGAGGPEFVDDNPNQPDERGEDGGASAGSSGTGGSEGGEGDPGDDDGDGGGGEREIAEADIIAIEGDRLYALSRFSGLAVIDVSDPDDLRILGRYRAHATPFEMYVENGRVFAMFSQFGEYAHEADVGYVWRQSSRLLALDATDPAEIVVDGEFELPGEIQDSRRVGDVLYLVTYESPDCWGCAVQVPRTVVTSLEVSDPADVRTVDEMVFEDAEETYGWGPRSVSSTDQRLYVAGPEYVADTGEQRSIIDVVDISDPTGTMSAGAHVQVAGQIESRWQMDEHDGVLRVVSQPGSWDPQSVPVIETFAVASASEISAMGSLAMTLPRPERLRSVRFDGPRGYAITFEQTDPLFTLDLSVPATPRQVGELEIPGWVYHMEPRGDRILALGFDQDNPAGSINVSLFDVSTFDQPALIDRVHFGGDWAQFAEDQNRIHKAFSILDDLGLLLVPFSGWEQSDPEDYCGNYRSGVQLVDFAADGLTLRGLAPAKGEARRALIHRERLLTVSDEQVAAFDFADRDAPTRTDDLALAAKVSQSAPAGEYLVRMSADWWTDDVVLEVVPASDGERADPIGALDLTEVIPPAVDPYEEGACGDWRLANARLHAVDGFAYLVMSRPLADVTQGYKERRVVATIDVRDPATPTYLGMLELPTETSSYYYGGSVGSMGDLGIANPTEVIHDGRLFMAGFDNLWDEAGQRSRSFATLDVVDLSDPAQPRHVATLQRPEALAHGGLQVSAGTVLSWHAQPVGAEEDKIAFYLERWVGSEDGSVLAAPRVNVPGVPVAGPTPDRMLAIGFRREVVPSTPDTGCYAHPRAWSSTAEGDCVLMRHPVNLVRIEGDRAHLLATAVLDGDLRLQSAHLGDQVAFAQLIDQGNYGWGYDDGGYGGPIDPPRSEVVVLGGLGASELHEAGRIDVGGTNPWGGWASARLVRGARLVVDGGSSLGIVDATNPTAPTLTTHSLYGYGCSDLDVDGARLHCALNEHGLQTLGLGAP